MRRKEGPDWRFATIMLHWVQGNDNASDTFEWVGDTTWPVRISKHIFKAAPDLLSRLPWPLVQIGEQTEEGVLLFERADMRSRGATHGS